MDALKEPRPGVVAVHVEGLPRDGERAPDGIDYELTDADGHVVLAVQVKARAPGIEDGGRGGLQGSRSLGERSGRSVL